MYCQYTYNMVGVIKVKTEVLRMLKETDDYKVDIISEFARAFFVLSLVFSISD